ncbi:MAG: hypothetical protein QP798_07240 [Staphylococcus simulans]|uniref:hypothetical protein n=1 Tax=Staphylococcus simulans TaxID=1286 RepID=UPI002552CA0E|nr:hypothetical protein [Staphylococcus simulans]MDK7927077.1 hypothetical protein [Staphylococcus simulans]MDK8315725.1 hypothetical protein [Staphylococcus simulans]
MKRFKYCNEAQLHKAFENYRYGGNTNLIYVWITDDYVETIEVFENDIHMSIFDSEEEMHDFFRNSGEPLIKDYVEGKQLKLF